MQAWKLYSLEEIVRETTCDRCRAVYAKDHVNDVPFPVLNRRGKTRNEDDLRKYDLCPDCTKGFEAWLRNGEPAPRRMKRTKWDGGPGSLTAGEGE